MNKINVSTLFVIATPFCMAFVFMWYIGPSKPVFHKMWSYIISLFTFALVFRFPFAIKEYPIVKFFASISYPLYVIHGAAGYVVMRLLLENNLSTFTTLSLVTLGAVSISWIIHIVIEEPTQRIGKSLSKLSFGRKKFTSHTEVTVS